MKKRQTISPTLWTMFPYLKKVFDKQKQVFGNVLDCINYFLLYGKDVICQNREYLTMLVEIAKASLFSMQPVITVQNSEGAILL